MEESKGRGVLKSSEENTAKLSCDLFRMFSPGKGLKAGSGGGGEGREAVSPEPRGLVLCRQGLLCREQCSMALWGEGLQNMRNALG